MQIGDIAKITIWKTGLETPEQLRLFKEDAEEALTMSVRAEGYEAGPVWWEEFPQGTAGCPPVPEGIYGPDVRLVVVSAPVTWTRRPVSRFTQELEPYDLAVLRNVTRRKYAEAHPYLPPLHDGQCDTLINDLGPEAALDELRGLTKSDLVLH